MVDNRSPHLRQPTKWRVDGLKFDPENPRFTPDMEVDDDSDPSTIRGLNGRADLQELIQSISASGYVDIEPLVVMFKGRELIVLEGNRRLAALKVLSDPSLAREADIQIPQVNAAFRRTLEEVTVYRVEDRASARDFIGFKHINGPHRWDSLAKAKFAAEWFVREQAKGVTVANIARRMGDRHDTIRRMVVGYFVLDQAKRNKIFSVSGRFPAPGPIAFSHLYTALDRPSYREFLGLPEDWRTAPPSPDAVPKNKLENLRKLLVWLFGSKDDDEAPIVTSQNPHLKQLGEVLSVPKARAMLINQGDLKQAFALVERPLDAFEKHLTSAHNSLRAAQGGVDAFLGDDITLIEIAAEVSSKADLIHQVMMTAQEKFKTRASSKTSLPKRR